MEETIKIETAKVIEQPKPGIELPEMIEVEKTTPEVVTPARTTKIRYTKAQLEKMVADGEMAKQLLEKFE